MKKELLIVIGMLYFGSQIHAQKFPKPNCTTLVGDEMLKEVDTTKARGVSDNYSTWTNG